MSLMTKLDEVRTRDPGSGLWAVDHEANKNYIEARDIDDYYPFVFDERTIKWDRMLLFPHRRNLPNDWFKGKTEKKEVMYYPDDHGFNVLFIRLGECKKKKRTGKPMTDVEAGRNCVRNYLSVVCNRMKPEGVPNLVRPHGSLRIEGTEFLVIGPRNLIPEDERLRREKEREGRINKKRQASGDAELKPPKKYKRATTSTPKQQKLPSRPTTPPTPYTPYQPSFVPALPEMPVAHNNNKALLPDPQYHHMSRDMPSPPPTLLNDSVQRNVVIPSLFGGFRFEQAPSPHPTTHMVLPGSNCEWSLRSFSNAHSVPPPVVHIRKDIPAPDSTVNQEHHITVPEVTMTACVPTETKEHPLPLDRTEPACELVVPMQECRAEEGVRRIPNTEWYDNNANTFGEALSFEIPVRGFDETYTLLDATFDTEMLSMDSYLNNPFGSGIESPFARSYFYY